MTAGTTSGWWHIGVHVSDLDTSVRFYTELLGLDLVHRQDQHNAYTGQLVGHPDAHLRVAQLRLPTAAPFASTHHLELVEYVIPRLLPAPLPRGLPGTAHLAVCVQDAQTTYSRLCAEGVEFVSPPIEITAGVNRGGWCCYFLDPDAITLELVQPPAVIERTGAAS